MCVTTLHISMLCGLLVVKYTNKMLFQNLSGLFFYTKVDPEMVSLCYLFVGLCNQNTYFFVNLS